MISVQFMFFYALAAVVVGRLSSDFVDIITIPNNPLGEWYNLGGGRELISRNWWLAKVLTCDNCLSHYMGWGVGGFTWLLLPQLRAAPLPQALFLMLAFGFLCSKFIKNS